MQGAAFDWVVPPEAFAMQTCNSHLFTHYQARFECHFSVRPHLPFLQNLRLRNLRSLQHAVVTNSSICMANLADEKLIEMAQSRKGKILSPKKEVVSYLDSGQCITVDGVTYTFTIQHCKCELLVNCTPVLTIMAALRSIYSNYHKQKSANNGANLCNMQTPQKVTRIKALKKALQNKQRQLQNIDSRLTNSFKTTSEELLKTIRTTLKNFQLMTSREYSGSSKCV